jgi:hypothetical protein
VKLITSAKRKPDFNPHTFLSTIGKGRVMVSFQKKSKVFAQGDSRDGLFFVHSAAVPYRRLCHTFEGPDPSRNTGRHGLEHSVFGKVKAQIQFLHSGADGIPLAQAFRFIEMDDVSRERFSAAAEQMHSAGFSDVEEKGISLGNLTSQSMSKLRDSMSCLSVLIKSARK